MNLKTPRTSLSRLSIQNKLLVINLTVTSIALIFAVIMAIVGEYITKRDYYIESLQVQAKMVANNTTAAIVFNDPGGAKDILQAFTSSPDINVAVIYNAADEVLAHFIKPGIKTGISEINNLYEQDNSTGKSMHVHGETDILHNKIHIVQNIIFEEEMIGKLFIQADISSLYEDIMNYFIYTTIVALIGLGLASLLLLKLRESITNPIQHLSRLMNSVIQKDDYSIRSDNVSSDEIGTLSQGFNKMLAHIQVNDEKLAYELSERYKAEKHLDKLAYYDVVTDLPNRHFFHDHLERTVENAITTKRKMALLFLDLDNFKIVNDTLGHKTGDLLLQQSSARLSNVLRQNDYICRIGGDEFAIIIEKISNIDDISIVAEKCIEALSNPFVFDGNNFYIGVSIGISVCPDDSITANELLVNADMAMYDAKARGKNNYQYYNQSMNDTHSRKYQLENDLRNAINENQLELYYQPLCDSKTGMMTAVEALMRWHHPEKGLISPDEFIPIAEETGLILPLGDWLIETAFTQCKILINAGMKDISMAINISAIQIREDAFVSKISRALDTYGVAAERIEFELTETILMDDSEIVIDKVDQLKAIGVQVSIDDFGTGFSSMNYLKSFPISKLKIDKSFISGLPESQEDIVITRAIIAMAHGMGLKVVAEGVEHGDQVELLHKLDCDLFQGYHFARPMTLDDLLALYGQQQDLEKNLYLVKNN